MVMSHWGPLEQMRLEVLPALGLAGSPVPAGLGKPSPQRSETASAREMPARLPAAPS